MYEITVESEFCASHALRLADGTVEPVHGHNWPVAVTVASERLDAMQTVMDFHQLEAIIAQVISPWHNRHLNDVEPFADGEVNPSAERVAWWVGTQVAQGLPEPVRVVAVRVGEAPRCSATWRA